jgi:ribonuclease PH
MGLNLELLGERQLIVDCDVLQADGGTRTAAVTGGWLAVTLALRQLIDEGELPQSVQRNQIAAISVGLLDGLPLLDLAYREDLTAEMDLNVVMTATGQIVEIQGTAEKDPVPRAKLDKLISLAASGIETLVEMQQRALDSA